MKLEVMRANELTTPECNKLRSLTLRKHGQLRDALTTERYFPDATVIRLSADDGTVLSWGMVFPYAQRKKLDPTQLKFLKAGAYDFQLYTRASERNKGYATIVYDKAVELMGSRTSLIVHPHTIVNTRFFNEKHFRPAGLPDYNFPVKGQ